MRIPLHLRGDPYWDDATGQMVEPPYADAWEFYIDGIDDNGRIYGAATMPPVSGGDPTYLIWVWDAGEVTELILPGGVHNSDAPVMMNNDGRLVATVMLPGWIFKPIIWQVGDPTYDWLPVMENTERGLPWAMNQAGQIAGFISNTDNTTHAVGWGMVLAPPSALDVSQAMVTPRGKKLLTVTVEITNPSIETAYDVMVTASTLGGVNTNVILPMDFGAIKPGATKKVTLQFKDVSSGDVTFTLNGTSSLGVFYTTQTVAVP